MTTAVWCVQLCGVFVWGAGGVFVYDVCVMWHMCGARVCVMWCMCGVCACMMWCMCGE